MTEQQELSTAVADPPAQPVTTTAPPENHKADAKQMRVDQVGALLSVAYQGASTLKLNKKETDELTADFPPEEIEIRSFDGIIYIPHMALRERLWKVFGPTEVAEICRERMMRTDSNECAVDLVLMIRGKFVAEGIGTAKWYPQNAKTSFGDTVESAWSEALRRCCKKIGVGTQVWRPGYVRQWLAENATQFQNKWMRKDDPRAGAEPPAKKTGRSYEIKNKGEHFHEPPKQVTPGIQEDDDIPF